MGIERIVVFPAGTPGWSIIRDQLVAAGSSPSMRMIDGMPAFPDETPEPTWSELRISFGAGGRLDRDLFGLQRPRPDEQCAAVGQHRYRDGWRRRPADDLVEDGGHAA